MVTLTKSNKKGLIKWLDNDVLTWKEWKIKKFYAALLEVVDGTGVNMGIVFIEGKFFSKIPEEYSDEINGLVEAFLNKDYETVAKYFADIAEGAIPTPFIDGTEEEKLLYKAIFDYLLSLIK